MSLNQTFQDQVRTNGTGVSRASQVLKGYNTLGAFCALPSGAKAANTFFVINPNVGVTGTCNGKLSDGSNSPSPFNGNNPIPGDLATSPNPYGSDPTWACSDEVLLVNDSGQNDAIMHVQDECPVCSSGFGGNGGSNVNTVAHIDTYSSKQGCTSKAVGNDYGNRYAIRISR